MKEKEEYKYRITQKGQSLVINFNFDHTGILLEVPGNPNTGGLVRNAIRDNLPYGIIDTIDDSSNTRLVYHFGALTDMNDIQNKLDQFLTEQGFVKMSEPNSKDNTNQHLPEYFEEALKQQIREQYEVIVRYRQLKNSTADVEKRMRIEEEIQHSLRNIEEIKIVFLEQAKVNNMPISSVKSTVSRLESEFSLQQHSGSGDNVGGDKAVYKAIVLNEESRNEIQKFILNKLPKYNPQQVNDAVTKAITQVQEGIKQGQVIIGNDKEIEGLVIRIAKNLLTQEEPIALIFDLHDVSLDDATDILAWLSEAYAEISGGDELIISGSSFFDMVEQLMEV